MASITDTAHILSLPLLSNWSVWWLPEAMAIRIAFQVPPGRGRYVPSALIHSLEWGLKYALQTHTSTETSNCSGLYLIRLQGDNNCEIHSDLAYLESVDAFEMLLPMALCFLHRNMRLRWTEEEEIIVTRQMLSRKYLFVLICSAIFRFVTWFGVMLFQCLFPENKYGMKILLMDPCKQKFIPGCGSSW